jgi:hypothetical protein
MAKLTLIKKIVEKDVVNNFNLMLNILFGGKTPELYDENKIYNKGECVIIQKDGIYKLITITKDNVSGPYNEENTKEVVFTELFKDGTIVTQNSSIIKNTQQALTDDIASLLYELAGLVDNRLMLNTLYRENFKQADQISITKGLFVPGSISAIPDHGLDFKLSEPVVLKTLPNVFKLKHYIELTGFPTIGCVITFNALDKKPYWFYANNALVSSDFFEIPYFEKDADVPYALNIHIYGDCPETASLKISDLMVVFV